MTLLGVLLQSSLLRALVEDDNNRNTINIENSNPMNREIIRIGIYYNHLTTLSNHLPSNYNSN